MKCFMTSQECIHEGELRDIKIRNADHNDINRIFVVSPFGYPYDDIYYDYILKLEDSNKFVVTRADRAVQLGFVMCQKICKEIRKADYVLIDMSEPNPNVYYELGLAFGFGKKIVFLYGDPMHMVGPHIKPWIKFIGNRSKKFLNYEHIKLLSGDHPAFDSFSKIIEEYQFDCSDIMNPYKDPRSYIEVEQSENNQNKQLLFCLSSPLFDKDLILDSSHSILEKLGWELSQYDIKDPFTVGQLLNNIKSCKVCMVDVSHYSDSANPNTYWVLGLAHALGRDSIPITNRKKSSGFTPFDVRGLYQIYFESLKSFKDNLDNILKVIDKEYQIEIKEYPNRYIWDRILKPNFNLEVFTFGRGNIIDPKRDGGRTNVDTWDYQAVAKLSFFLAQKYKQATVVIQQPEDKRVGASDSEIEKRKPTIIEKLCEEKNYIIVGSPDVSDYAEILLATAYDIEPYVQLKCKNASCSGSLCKEQCIGRNGYIFSKIKYFQEAENGDQYHPRSKSFCYRDAKTPEEQGVLWYGKMYSCQSNITYGVITIFYANPIMNCQPTNSKAANSSLLVLSGFTGVATFGLAELLSGEYEVETINLKDELRKYEKETAVNILVRIEYDTKEEVGSHENRIFKNIIVENVRALKPVSKTVSSKPISAQQG